MATLVELRGQVRDNFYSNHPGERPFRQILGAGYLVGDLTITVPDGAKWAVGDVMENEDTGEQTFITGIATNVLTVTRGFNGTTAAAGTAGDVLNKNPRMTVRKMDNAIEAILLDLSSHGVYQRATDTLTVLPDKYLYEIDLDNLVEPPGVIDVFFVDSFSGLPVTIPYRQRQGLPAAVSSTGEAIVLANPDLGNTTTVYVMFGKAYTAVTELPARLDEVVVLGATGRVLGALIGQMHQDPGQHSNRTIPQGQASRDARWYQAEHLVAVRREAALLSAQYLGTGNIQSGRRRRWRP